MIMENENSSNIPETQNSKFSSHSVLSRSIEHSFLLSTSMDTIIEIYKVTSEAISNHLSLYSFIGISFLALILYFLFTPINRQKSMLDVGWSFLTKNNRHRSLGQAVAQVQRLRKIGNLPPVYPNGWFALTESKYLSKGEVKSVMALGETFAVFRDNEGVAHIIDAYCPHLGANLAVGGVVKGSCLECPFHGWQFDGRDGKCTTIPYAAKVPESAKVKHWESREINEMIFVWYDSEGRPPQYEVPTVQEISNGSWLYRGRTDHEVLAHIQEIPENGADLAHLGHLHVPNIMKGSDLGKIYENNKLMDFVSHNWCGEWGPMDSPNGHIAELQLRHAWAFFGGRFKLMETKVSVQQIGPSLVHLSFDTMVGKGLLIQTVTPEEPLKQRIIHRFYSSPLFITPIANMVIRIEAGHVERDVMVWNNKQFLSQPHLVKEDKLIMKYRRWYSQFYSENSPKMDTLRKNTLDW